MSIEQIIASDTSAYIEPPIEPALLDETQFRAWQAELNRYTTDPLELLAQAESMKNFDPTHQNNPTGQPPSVENYQPANQAVNTVQYHYNGDGNLVGKTVDGVRTDFALDVAADLPEVIYTSGGNRYLHLPGMIMTENAEGEVRYLLSDGLGSIRQVVDETGQVVASYEYDPYGNPMQTSGGDPYGYTGEWWENEVGLLHLRARWYSPETGTFISKDPSELEQNPYQYAASNPIRNVDPSGYVFVTFDDGPVNNDLEILDILRRNNAQATFFYHESIR
jgi:RHS repeat-associated protein